MMEPARWRLVKRVFHEALDRPESNRGRYLTATCGDDQQLRSEVEALLAAHADAGAFLASPTRGDVGEWAGETGSTVFEQLQRALAGRFSLERELGRGGMAIVYLARDVALDRPVALKLLPRRAERLNRSPSSLSDRLRDDRRPHTWTYQVASVGPCNDSRRRRVWAHRHRIPCAR